MSPAKAAEIARLRAALMKTAVDAFGPDSEYRDDLTAFGIAQRRGLLLARIGRDARAALEKP